VVLREALQKRTSATHSLDNGCTHLAIMDPEAMTIFSP